jgi:hypothetical protein
MGRMKRWETMLDESTTCLSGYMSYKSETFLVVLCLMAMSNLMERVSASTVKKQTRLRKPGHRY